MPIFLDDQTADPLNFKWFCGQIPMIPERGLDYK